MPIGYAGEYWDEETNFIYLRARYYDLDFSRFITQDPAKAGDDWYAYCDNNPVMGIDPWGLDHYIYYGIDQLEKAQVANQFFIDTDPGTPVHMILVNTKGDFYKAWNSMDSDSGNGKIEYVVIMLHGTSGYIKSSQPGKIYASELERKKIDTILLTACNTGNMNFDNNFASQLAMSQDVRQVIAPDGYRQFRTKAHVGSCYIGDEEGGSVDRKGNGFVLYQNIGGNLVITPGLTEDGGGDTIPRLIEIGRAQGFLNRANDLLRSVLFK